MTTLYRIRYKIVEPKTTLEGVRVVEMPIDRYIESLRKQHPDAASIYLELIEEFEQADVDEDGDYEGVIILG